MMQFCWKRRRQELERMRGWPVLLALAATLHGKNLALAAPSAHPQVTANHEFYQSGGAPATRREENDGWPWGKDGIEEGSSVELPGAIFP